jgi:hypothetical protein
LLPTNSDWVVAAVFISSLLLLNLTPVIPERKLKSTARLYALLFFRKRAESLGILV